MADLSGFRRTAGNRTALITGGTRGIGAATAALLSQEGWRVLAPGRAEMDIADGAAVLRFLGALGGKQRLEALVLNAGMWNAKPRQLIRGDDFVDQFKLLWWHWTLMHSLLTGNDHGVGCVIGVASKRALIGGVSCMAYATAKAALVTMMLGCAREWPGTRFNAVCPGWTDTGMGRQVKATGGVSDPEAKPQSAVGVARVIVGLIGDGKSNGRVVVVENGEASEARWVVR